MPSLKYQDLEIDVSFGGDFHIKLRSLDVRMDKNQIAQLIYPILDAQEKALHAPQPASSGDSGPVSS